MYSRERNDLCRDLIFKLQDRLDAPPDIRTPINVVPQEHDDIAVGDLPPKLVKQVGQRRQVPVDVTDRNRCHHRNHAIVAPAFVRTSRSGDR